MRQTRSLWTLGLFACLLALGACGGDEQPKQASVNQTMPNLPLPPNAEFLSRSGSADALQLVFQSAATPDFVAGYYRNIFSTGGWSLVSDLRQPDSTLVLYAEQSGHPMWVRIKPTGQTSRIELMGAIPGADSAYARAAKAARDTTNTMRPINR
jgi:hypothetical protein